VHLSDDLSDYTRLILLPTVSIAQIPEPLSQEQVAPVNSEYSRFQLIARVQPDGDQQAEAVLRMKLQADTELQSLQGYLHTARQALQPWLAIMPEVMTTTVVNPADLEAELWFDWVRDQQLNVNGHLQMTGLLADQSGNAFMAADVAAEFKHRQWALALQNLA